MGARGKKRVRANGQVASGKLRPAPRPRQIPAVEAGQVRDALAMLQTALAATDGTASGGPGFDAAYGETQRQLRELQPAMLADAILWRATFLHSLVEWDEFREAHGDEGDLPTAAMLDVAATIPTYGDETSFDLEHFEDMLADRVG